MGAARTRPRKGFELQNKDPEPRSAFSGHQWRCDITKRCLQSPVGWADRLMPSQRPFRFLESLQERTEEVISIWIPRSAGQTGSQQDVQAESKPITTWGLFVVGFSRGHAGWSNHFRVVPGLVSAAVLRQAGRMFLGLLSCSARMFAPKYVTKVAHCQVWRKQRRPLMQVCCFPQTPVPNGLLLHFLTVLLPRLQSCSSSQSRGGELQKGLGFP